jgi:hypothetical protein
MLGPIIIIQSPSQLLSPTMTDVFSAQSILAAAPNGAEHCWRRLGELVRQLMDRETLIPRWRDGPAGRHLY